MGHSFWMQGAKKSFAATAPRSHGASAAARPVRASDRRPKVRMLSMRSRRVPQPVGSPARCRAVLAPAEAEAISGALQGRRAAFTARGTQRALSPSIGLSARRWATPRSPDKQASIERRRGQAMSGIVPAKIAANFTQGEVAILTVIARQCQRGGTCVMPIAAIAALAGVSPLRALAILRLLEKSSGGC